MYSASDKAFHVNPALLSRMRQVMERELGSVDDRIAAIQTQVEPDHTEDEIGDWEELDEHIAETEEMKSLKAQRCELLSVLGDTSERDAMSHRLTSLRRTMLTKALVSGYTVIVFDMKLLIADIELLDQIAKNAKFQIVIPLIVVTELDKLSKEDGPHNSAAEIAIAAVERLLAVRKIRVVTLKGSSLSSLAVRSEPFDTSAANYGKSFCDQIIEAVRHQNDQHESVRGIVPIDDTADTAVLVSGERSTRTAARAKGVRAVAPTILRKAILAKKHRNG